MSQAYPSEKSVRQAFRASVLTIALVFAGLSPISAASASGDDDSSDRSLKGVVSVADSGTPLAGVTVSVLANVEDDEEPYTWSSSVESDADGAYVVEQIPGEVTSVEVRVSDVPDGYLVPNEIFPVDINETGETIFDFEIFPSPSGELELSGQVSSSIGGGLPGVQIYLYGEVTGGSTSFSVTTGADGAFRFENLPEGTYSLAIWEFQGHLSWLREEISIDSDQIINPVLVPLTDEELIVFVVDKNSGDPVDGALVGVSLENNREGYWSAYSDDEDLAQIGPEEGRFVFSPIPAGVLRVDLVKSPAGYFDRDQEAKTIDTTGEGPFVIELELIPLPEERNKDISGTVFDKESGQPIHGATVSIWYTDFSNSETADLSYSRHVETDADGSYIFGELWSAIFWISVEAEGYTSRSGIVRVRDIDDSAQRNFSLSPPPPNDSVLDLTFYTVEGGSQVPVVGLEVTAGDQTDSTNDDGEVSFQLPAGEVNFYLANAAPGFDDSRPRFQPLDYFSTVFVLSPDAPVSESIELVEIDYSAGNAQTIGGVVRDQFGVPLDGVDVSIISDLPGFYATTDSSGRWSIPSVPHGSYSVSLYAQPGSGGYYMQFTDVLSVPQAAPNDIPIVMEKVFRGEASLTVIMRDQATHQRVSGDTVAVWFNGAPDDREATFVNGEATFTNLIPGRHTVVAFSQKMLTPEVLQVEVGQTGHTTVTLRGESLDLRGTVRVNVRQLFDGLDTDPSIDGVWVGLFVVLPQTAQSDDDPLITEGEDFGGFGLSELTADGMVEFTGVPLGRELELSVFPPYGPFGESELVPHTERFTLTDETPKDFDVFMVEGGSVVGSVVMPNPGESLSGIGLVARSTSSGYWSGAASIQSNGTFRIDGLPQGEYDLIVQDWKQSGPAVVSETLVEFMSVSPSEDTAVGTLTLRRGAQVSGTLTTEIDGVEVALPPTRWVSVEVLNEDRVPLRQYRGWAWGSSGGEFTIRGLDPDKQYFLRFSGPVSRTPPSLHQAHWPRL